MSSAGGKATAIILRKQSLERYYANPNICLNCGKIIEVGNRKVRQIRVKKFCNHHCSAEYNNRIRNSNHKYKYHCKKCGAILKSKKRFCDNCKPKFYVTKTRLYSIYQGMKDRCYQPKVVAYKNYGGRGIKICNEWLNDFMSFYDWATANGYQDNLTIERINNNGDYEPSNCKWITKAEQSNNRRCNHRLTYNGETHTITEWAKIFEINRNTLYNRFLKNGLNQSIFEKRDLRFRCNSFSRNKTGGKLSPPYVK